MRDALLQAHIGMAAALFPLIERLLPLRALLWLAEQPGRWTPYRGVPGARVLALINHRLRAPRYLRRRQCLRRGMLSFHFLRLAGVPAVMQFGVVGPVTSGRRLLAHCWVTVAGQAEDPPSGNCAVVLTRATAPSPA